MKNWINTALRFARGKNAMKLSKIIILALVMMGGYGLIFQCSQPNPVSTQIIESSAIQHRADIHLDEVWRADSIHVIANPISVHHAILRIEPGATVKFARDAALSILDSAGLIADGSAQTIHFTSDSKEKGSWKYIYFSSKALRDSCRLIHCNLEYGGGDSLRNGIIFCDRTSPTIRSCIISKSKICGVVLRGDCSRSQFDSNLVANCDFVPIQTYPINVPLLSRNMYQDNGLNQIRISHRLINFSATWNNFSLPYLLADGLEIRAGKLVLEPGIELAFEDHEDVSVLEGGVLAANGTATDPIVFIGSGNQSWRGIYFAATADFSRSSLVHCIIEKGGSDDQYPGNLVVESGLPAMANCIIHLGERYGVYGIGTLTSNHFSDNMITRNSQAPISIPANGVPFISNGKFDGNAIDVIEVRGGNDDGFVTQNGYWQNLEVPYLLKNTIDINSGTIIFAPGAKILMANGAGIIVRNGGGLIANGAFAPIEIIGERPAPGAWHNISFSSTASEKNCQLVNCYLQFGGGDLNQPGMIYCDHISPTIKNCTIEFSQTWGIYLNGQIQILDLATNFFQNNVYGSYYQAP